MERLRQLAVPHMLLCVLMLALGVVLILSGAAGLGLILLLLTCFVVMAWVVRMGRSGDSRAGGQHRQGGGG